MIKRKSEMTKMAILIEIMHGKKKIKDISKSVNITIQGVSEYIKLLKKEGYIDKNMNITMDGVDFVYKKMEELRSFITEVMSDMKFITNTEAIAGEEIKKGERVGLFMENGYMYAYKRKSSSTGLATYDAMPGEDINISDLEGILDLSIGDITVVRLPSSKDGGSRRVDIKELKKLIRKGVKKGVIGSVAYVTLKKNGIEIDFEYGVVRAAQEAAHRGFSSIIFVSSDLFKYTIEDLEREIPGLSKVPYNVIDLSNGHKKY
ncbi:MAG: winged helix-turn-helix transcriptional regulator [Thermoplasmata archaeon]|jgi:putative transcriptional regulator|nr:winged helix-turn-helix transcriptional regulator [Thermoplasmata archaeon]